VRDRIHGWLSHESRQGKFVAALICIGAVLWILGNLGAGKVVMYGYLALAIFLGDYLHYAGRRRGRRVIPTATARKKDP
jgi:hypothetical protein